MYYLQFTRGLRGFIFLAGNVNYYPTRNIKHYQVYLIILLYYNITTLITIPRINVFDNFKNNLLLSVI